MRMVAWMAAAGAVMMAVSASAADEGAWIKNDFAAAKAKAQKENKNILVDFSGSDWCGWCIKLDKEVFSTPEFTDAASKEYVLAVLDFPRKPENRAKIPAEQAAANEKMIQEFKVQGFPTVLIMNKDGELMGRTGYAPGGPDAYLKSLEKIKADYAAKKAALAKAQQPGLSAVERAKALDAALRTMGEDEILPAYRKEVDEIIAADAKNELGLKSHYVPMTQMERIEAAMQQRDVPAALAVVDGWIKDLSPKGEDLQNMQGLKFQILMASKNRAEALIALQKAIDAAPQSEVAPRMKMLLERLSAPPVERMAPPAASEAK